MNQAGISGRFWMSLFA